EWPALESCRHGFFVGYFRHARAAPVCPEIDEHHLAAESAQFNLLAVHVFAGDFRRHSAGAWLLRIIERQWFDISTGRRRGTGRQKQQRSENEEQAAGLDRAANRCE